MSDHSRDFGTTMDGLSRGLRVAEIATFEPKTASSLDTMAELRVRFSKYEFDHLPVRDGDRIVGVVDVYAHKPTDHVGDIMAPLSDRMLISASDPISDLVPLFQEGKYKLVVHRGKIDGIVTRSDLLKLPVRVLAFSQIAHLEMLMAAFIISEKDSDGWINDLAESRRTKVLTKQQALAKQEMDPPLIECCDFCDKRDLVRKYAQFTGKFDKDLKQIENLRNQVAHSANYVESADAADRFVTRFMLTTHWIGELDGMVDSN